MVSFSKRVYVCLFALILMLPAIAGAQIRGYQNYDFVPGNEMIFEDSFDSDVVGEWPAHWNLDGGQGSVTKTSGSNMLVMTEGYLVSPLMTKEHYLSDSFSLEFDAVTSESWYGSPFVIQFHDAEGTSVDIAFALSTVWFTGLNERSLEAKWGGDENKLYHFAIAYKNDQLKVYIGEQRILVVPKVGLKPVTLVFQSGADEEFPKAFDNVRIANGADMNMLNALMTDGKFTTYGITFDVSKATLRPESMGTLNQINTLLKENPDLKLEVGGHTDGDGSNDLNMKLSQQRAETVVKQLVSMGVAPSRLTAKGYGETKPIASNDTFDGKAKNRRVEFKKVP